MSASGDNEVKETEYERTLARIGIATWNDYQEKLLPLENRLLGEVRTTAGEMSQATGYANAASEQQFDDARAGLRENLFAGGFNPASGGFASRMAKLGSDEALATGMSGADIGQAMSDQEVYGLKGFVDLGQGTLSDAFSGFGTAANSAQDQAISDARNALNERLAMQQTVGQVAGAATAYGMTRPTGGTTGAGLQTNLFQQTGPSSWDTTGFNA